MGFVWTCNREGWSKVESHRIDFRKFYFETKILHYFRLKSRLVFAWLTDVMVNAQIWISIFQTSFFRANYEFESNYVERDWAPVKHYYRISFIMSQFYPVKFSILTRIWAAASKSGHPPQKKQRKKKQLMPTIRVIWYMECILPYKQSIHTKFNPFSINNALITTVTFAFLTTFGGFKNGIVTWFWHSRWE